MTVYHPLQQMGVAGRLFVHASGDPYALVPAVTRVIQDMSANQPVERAATLEDVRAEVLAPERLNAFVFTGFAGVALLIAVVGVAGVLAFGVSARTREFGVRLAIGSTPFDLLKSVLSEGVVIVSIGIVAGAAFGYLFAGIAVGLLRDHANAGSGVAARRGRGADRRGDRRLADAGRARLTDRRAAGAALRIEIHHAITRWKHHMTNDNLGVTRKPLRTWPAIVIAALFAADRHHRAVAAIDEKLSCEPGRRCSAASAARC